MHAESGFWRPKPDGTIEVVISQSTGLVEVQVLALLNCGLKFAYLCYIDQCGTALLFFFSYLWLLLKGIGDRCAFSI